MSSWKVCSVQLLATSSTRECTPGNCITVATFSKSMEEGGNFWEMVNNTKSKGDKEAEEDEVKEWRKAEEEERGW